MASFLRLTTVCLSLLSVVSARMPGAGRKMAPPTIDLAHLPSMASGQSVATDNITQTTFMQTLNHSDPNSPTFSQRYWYSTQWWKGPGSPVIFFTPGEISADGYEIYLTNASLTGAYAEAVGGAVVMMEHRYWGDSSPYPLPNTEQLQYLTLENAIQDATHLARTAQLPFDTSGKSNAPAAPWVFVGGSYSGALAAWTENIAPGTFWAYHATSAPVESTYDYWQYFYPVQEGMAKNCSKDVSNVISYMDNILMNGTPQQQQNLKEMFGLGNVTHNDDFMGVLENAPWDWQEIQMFTGYSEFFIFCDAIEGFYPGAPSNSSVSSSKPARRLNKRVPGAEGVGLQTALEGYAWFTKNYIIPGLCETFGYEGENSTGCFNTYDPNNLQYTNYSLANAADRQWVWMTCNEPFDYWQTGAPNGTATIVSRLLTAEYFQRQCALFFPEYDGFTFGSNEGKTAATENAFTGGWDFGNTTRLIWTNGQFDPWRETGVSSDFRPGGPLQSTPSQPLQIIPGGVHCTDLLLENAQVNAGVQTVVNNEVAQIKTWVAEFYQQNATSSSSKLARHRRPRRQPSSKLF